MAKRKPNSCDNAKAMDQQRFRIDDDGCVEVATTDSEGNVLLQGIIDAVNNINITGGGSGGVTCQKHVLNLIANTWVEVPHTYSNDVCDWKALDTLNEEIGVSFRYDATSLKLEVCSKANINNVLIVLNGEL